MRKFTLRNKNVFKDGRKFTLHGGRQSDFYVDLKTTPSEPKDMTYITNKLYLVLQPLKKAIIIGIELGGIIYVTSLATYLEAKKYTSDFHYALLRKERQHGNPRRLLHLNSDKLRKLASYDYEIVLVDDVVSSGDTFEEAMEYLWNEEQLRVTKLVAIHNRSSLISINNLTIQGVLSC